MVAMLHVVSALTSQYEFRKHNERIDKEDFVGLFLVLEERLDDFHHEVFVKFYILN
jgi:hypothetical protein